MRKISFWPGVAIVVGSIIGSGVFMKPASMAAQLGSPIALLLVWVLAGLFTFLGALVFAELGALFPITGGIYVYFKETFGPFFAFLYGWAAFAVINTAGIAAISYVCAAYTNHFLSLPEFSPDIVQAYRWHLPGLGDFYPLDHLGIKIVGVAIVLFLTWLNVLSLKGSSALQLVSTTAKLALLLGLVVALFLSGDGSSSHWTESPLATPEGGWLAAIALAMTGAFYAYDGWGNITFMAGEMESPQRNIPRVLLIGVLICVGVYVLINLAYLYVFPIDKMADSTLVASDAIAAAWGRTSADLVAAMIVICTLGAVNGNIMACSRVTFAMGKDRLFPKWTGRLRKASQTPANALWLQGIWTSLYLITGTFDMLADMFVFTSWVAYGMGAVALLVMRQRAPERKGLYRIWGYPWTPWIFLLFTAYYFVATIYGDVSNYLAGRQAIVHSLLGLLITAIGIPIFWLNRRSRQP